MMREGGTGGSQKNSSSVYSLSLSFVSPGSKVKKRCQASPLASRALFYPRKFGEKCLIVPHSTEIAGRDKDLSSAYSNPRRNGNIKIAGGEKK